MEWIRAGDNADFFMLMAATLVGPSGKRVAFDALPENIESVLLW